MSPYVGVYAYGTAHSYLSPNSDAMETPTSSRQVLMISMRILTSCSAWCCLVLPHGRAHLHSAWSRLMPDVKGVPARVSCIPRLMRTSIRIDLSSHSTTYSDLCESWKAAVEIMEGFLNL